MPSIRLDTNDSDEEGEGDSADLSLDSEELKRVTVTRNQNKSSASANTRKRKVLEDREEGPEEPTVAVAAGKLKALGVRPARLNASASASVANYGQRRSPLRSVTGRGVNNENQAPLPPNRSNLRSAAAQAPSQTLPQSLAHQIQSKAACLTDAQSSKANKWMKQKSTEGPGDMKSVLEKRFAEIRQFLQVEEEDDDDDTNFGDSNMPFM